MNKKDAQAKKFLADKERFADLFNVYLYDGEQVIHPDSLEERDTAELLNLYYGVDNKAISKQKWRDLLKRTIIQTAKEACYVLLGAENQSEIHYAMPVRNMIYDAINYGSQVEEAKRKHEATGKEAYQDAGEFLSGFTREDRLTPVITLVVYWGSKKWDGPLTLHEMLHVEDESILKFVSDYKVNLLAPSEIEDFSKFQTSVGEVLEIIKVSESMRDMQEVLKGNEAFTHLEADAVRMVNEFTKLKIQIKESEGEVDMCKAWEDWKQYNWELGQQEGRQEGRLEGALCILYDLVNDNIINLQEAAKRAKLSEEEFCEKMKQYQS